MGAPSYLVPLGMWRSVAYQVSRTPGGRHHSVPISPCRMVPSGKSGPVVDKRVAVSSACATGCCNAAHRAVAWPYETCTPPRLRNGEPLAIPPVLRDNVCVDPLTGGGGARRRLALVGTVPHQTRAATAHRAGARHADLGRLEREARKQIYPKLGCSTERQRAVHIATILRPWFDQRGAASQGEAGGSCETRQCPERSRAHRVG